MVQQRTNAGAETSLDLSDLRSVAEVIGFMARHYADHLTSPYEQTRFESVPVEVMNDVWEKTA